MLLELRIAEVEVVFEAIKCVSGSVDVFAVEVAVAVLFISEGVVGLALMIVEDPVASLTIVESNAEPVCEADLKSGIVLVVAMNFDVLIPTSLCCP